MRDRLRPSDGLWADRCGDVAVAPMLGANSPSATGGYQIMVVKRALCERLTALKLWRPLLQEGLRGQPHDVIPYVAPEIPSSPNKLGQDARFRAALRGVLGSPPCSRRCRSTRSPPPATAGADITPTGPASAPCCSQSCRDCRVWRVPGAAGQRRCWWEAVRRRGPARRR